MPAWKPRQHSSTWEVIPLTPTHSRTGRCLHWVGSGLIKEDGGWLPLLFTISNYDLYKTPKLSLEFKKHRSVLKEMRDLAHPGPLSSHSRATAWQRMRL